MDFLCAPVWWANGRIECTVKVHSFQYPCSIPVSYEGGRLRKLLSLTVLVCCLVGLVGTNTAQAKMKVPQKCHRHMELRTLEHCQAYAVTYANTVVNFWRNHPRIFKGRTPKIVHREYARLKWLPGELAQTRAKLRPAIKYKSSWVCIHNYEGAWNDAGDPYWGGLQMDRQFMYTYGRDMIAKYGGFANLWTPYDQMIVAERAHDSGRGFHPWPNTARYCKLI